MTTRRGFLRMLGIGAASAPTIGSEVAEGLALGYQAPMPALARTASESKLISASALKIIGVPEWMRSEWRERAKHIQLFDPDIAAMKSMSQSAKIYHQRNRNEKAEEERFFNRSFGNELRRNFFEKHGYPDGY